MEVDKTHGAKILRTLTRVVTRGSDERTAALHSRFAAQEPCKSKGRWRLLHRLQLWREDLEELKAAGSTPSRETAFLHGGAKGKGKGGKGGGKGKVPRYQCFNCHKVTDPPHRAADCSEKKKDAVKAVTTTAATAVRAKTEDDKTEQKLHDIATQSFQSSFPETWIKPSIQMLERAFESRVLPIIQMLDLHSLTHHYFKRIQDTFFFTNPG